MHLLYLAIIGLSVRFVRCRLFRLLFVFGRVLTQPVTTEKYKMLSMGIVYGLIRDADWFSGFAQRSLHSENAKIRFQTKMEDLSVEVYGDNGAYYKVCTW